MNNQWTQRIAELEGYEDAYHRLKTLLSLAHVALLDAGVSVPDFDQDIAPAIRELTAERDRLKQEIENIMDSLNAQDVSDYVDFMWREYGDCDPDKLSPAAAKIRDMLRKSAGVDRLRTLTGELAVALDKIKQFRLSALKSTCPDCDEDFGKTCDHGASVCKILKQCNKGIDKTRKEGVIE
jgi:hypothetical protein